MMIIIIVTTITTTTDKMYIKGNVLLTNHLTASSNSTTVL